MYNTSVFFKSLCIFPPSLPPIPLQAVCSRCKSEYKCHTGNTVVLCRLCSDQREVGA